jgi:signal transduction histidine kinase
MTRPRLTVRMRLTFIYGGMLLLAGSVLIAIFYTIFRANFPGGDLLNRSTEFRVPHRPTDVITLPSGDKITYADFRDYLDQRRDAMLADLLRQCLTALAAVAALAVGFGWWMAGRALRPVHNITATARRVAARNLHERIALRGPRDELTELADTFDAMLERLDAAFDSQRRFVANASHELRTPLATNRTLLEVALAQRHVPPDLRDVIDTMLATNRRNEALIDGLLTLTRSENPESRLHPVDLSDIAAEAVEQTAAEASTASVTVDAVPDAAPTTGDPVLLERLALNLLRNAIQHNHAGGHVTITTGPDDESGHVALTVTNTGPVIAPEDTDAMFEPFRRLGDNRTNHSQGVGLGLSIVRTITHTHGGTISTTPRDGGGLDVRIQLRTTSPGPTPCQATQETHATPPR